MSSSSSSSLSSCSCSSSTSFQLEGSASKKSTQGENRVCLGGDRVARGEGESEDAWAENPSLPDWFRAVRGSKNKTAAEREAEDGAGGQGRDVGDEDGWRATGEE